MWKFIKNNTLIAIGIILLIFSLIVYLISLIPSFKLDKTPKSEDSVVNSAIDLIDESLGKFGTFNTDHLPIFQTLEKLTKNQIIRLHKDFGYRYYNPLFRTYKIVDNLGFRGYSQKKGLNALYLSELDEKQILRLSNIYKSKGLQYPFL